MKILSSQLNLLGRTAGVVLMLVTGFYCDSNKVSSQALVPEIDSFVENTQQSSNVVEIELLNSLNSMRDRFQLKTKRLSLEKCLAMGLKQNILLAAAYASIQKQCQRRSEKAILVNKVRRDFMRNRTCRYSRRFNI